MSRSFCPSWLEMVTLCRDGTVTACDGWRNLTIGRWDESGFLPVWESEEARRFREAHVRGFTLDDHPHPSCKSCLIEGAHHLIDASSRRVDNLLVDSNEGSLPLKIVVETPVSEALIPWLHDLPAGIKVIAFGPIGSDPLKGDVEVLASAIRASVAFEREVHLETSGQVQLDPSSAEVLVRSGVDIISVKMDGSSPEETELSHGPGFDPDSCFRLARLLHRARVGDRPRLVWSYGVKAWCSTPSSIENAKEVAAASHFDRIEFRKAEKLGTITSLKVPVSDRVVRTGRVSVDEFTHVTDNPELFERIMLSTLGCTGINCIDIGIHGHRLEEVWEPYVKAAASDLVCFTLNHSDCDLYDHVFSDLLEKGRRILVLDYTDMEVERDDVEGRMLVLRAQTVEGSHSKMLPYVPGTWDPPKGVRYDPGPLEEFDSDLFFAGQMQLPRFRFMREVFERSRIAGLRCDLRWSNSMGIEGFLNQAGRAKMCFDYKGFGLLCYRFMEMIQSGIPAVTVRNRARWFRKPPDRFFVDGSRDLVERTAAMSRGERIDLAEAGREFFESELTRAIFREHVSEEVASFF